jgi:hypothetical protein
MGVGEPEKKFERKIEGSRDRGIEGRKEGGVPKWVRWVPTRRGDVGWQEYKRISVGK